MENGGALYMNPTQCSLDFLHAYSGALEGEPTTAGSDTAPRTTDVQFQYLVSWGLPSLGDQVRLLIGQLQWPLIRPLC